MRFKVIHLGELDLSRPTGTGQAVQGLVAALREAGVEAEIASTSHSGPGVTVLPRSGWVRRKELAWLNHADILHFHGAFVPALRIVAARANVPYVVTPHGGYEPMVFVRGRRVVKRLYLNVWERPFLDAAQQLIALTEPEALNLKRLQGSNVSVLPNSVDLVVADQVDDVRKRTPRGAEAPVIFLGRADVTNKGLDRLARIAALLPNVRFVAYLSGTRGPLGLQTPPNMRVADPVYGEAKSSALARARAYIQLSRWESFGMSIAEAASAGIPVVLSPENNLAEEMSRAGACRVVDTDDPKSVCSLRCFLTSEDGELAEVGRRARNWATRNLARGRIAQIAQQVYGEVVDPPAS